MAVANYESANKHFPPPFTVDDNGNRLHSWRTLILPYLGEQQLFDKINFDEPWNSESNRVLADQMPSIYSFHGEHIEGKRATNYLAIVGSNTMWPATGVRRWRDVTDGHSKTILIVENAGCQINWMEPRDLELNTLPRQIPHTKGISSNYLGPAVAMASFGLTHFHDTIDPQTVLAMISINGSEPLELTDNGWSVISDGRDRSLPHDRLNGAP